MVQIVGFHHAGIRVTDAARSTDFYEKLGFRVSTRHHEGRVIVMHHPGGVEINLIANGVPHPSGRNPLMDLPEKHPGHTHVALRVPSIADAVAALKSVDVPITEGPVKLGPGMSLFVRDPDGSVVELRQDLSESET